MNLPDNVMSTLHSRWTNNLTDYANGGLIIFIFGQKANLQVPFQDNKRVKGEQGRAREAFASRAGPCGASFSQKPVSLSRSPHRSLPPTQKQEPDSSRDH
jgi:hypothetical protein